MHRIGQINKLFPTKETKNLIICLPGIGERKGFSSLISSYIFDLNAFDGGIQCFPLYYYEKRSINHPMLFDAGNEEDYTRHDGITNFILDRCREGYGPKVNKEDIFYYVYGLLHSPTYRRNFAADLKKKLPRLPLVEKPTDFWAFSKAGRALADLHLNYESQPVWPEVKVDGVESGKFHVTKMRFPNKGDKSVIEYNPWIRVSNIPLEAYDYVINGRSAIEWVMERYQIKTDKASGITNDPNDWADEVGNPRYILDLLLSVLTVSMETIEIVKELPVLEVAAMESAHRHTNVWPRVPRSERAMSQDDYRQELAANGNQAGVEPEDDIHEFPFDADKITISSVPVPVSRLLERLKKETISSPAIQRSEDLWTIQQQSRLIESLMLRIPLPLFYVAADNDENWKIVDGLQRVSALRNYLQNNQFTLSGLEFLVELNGSHYEDLPAKYQNRIMDTTLQFAVISSTTPPEVQRNVFKRLNTGGLPLSQQEIRHALYYDERVANL